MKDLLQGFFSTFSYINKLSLLPRSGWLLAGIPSPESVAEHSYGVTMVSMWLVDDLREKGQEVDGEVVLRMALLHDLAESLTTDIPAPVKRKLSSLKDIEEVCETQILANAPEGWGDTLQKYHRRDSLESDIVKSADRIQMMLQALEYERSSRLNLSEFFEGESKGTLELVQTIIKTLQEKHSNQVGY